jgi:hypothetical protein
MPAVSNPNSEVQRPGGDDPPGNRIVRQDDVRAVTPPSGKPRMGGDDRVA